MITAKGTSGGFGKGGLIFVKSHQHVHLKIVNFIACKL